MNNIFLKGIIISLTLMSTEVFANDMQEIYYWSNAKGWVNAEHCKIETAREPKFKIVDSVDNHSISLVRNEGNSNLNIVNESMVKIIDNDLLSNNMLVELVSVNSKMSKKLFSLPGDLLNKPWKAQAARGDQGIVNQNNLKSLKDYTIKINNDYKDVTGGDYWRIYYNQTHVKLNCPEFVENNDYILFNVYNESSKKMSLRVGVSTSETELFKDVLIFQKSNPISDVVNDLINSINEVILLPDTGVGNEELEIPVKDEVPSKEENEDSDVFKSQKGLDTIICTQQDFINVRNYDLSKVLFTAKPSERVKLFQGWGKNKIDGVTGLKRHTYIRVEFLDKEDQTQKIGYVVSSYVKAKSDCNNQTLPKGNGLEPKNKSFKGLDDKECCFFPTMDKVTTSFTKGMMRFGGSRGGGSRAHAAVDLYRYKNEPVYSVAPGVVIRDLYFFYQGTYALEVMHSGGFVVRYGEMTGQVSNNIAYGSQISMADRVGYIGKVNSGCCEPMLHFELYSGKQRGPLTQNGAGDNGVVYNRRRDLLNPTHYMIKWQNKKFNKK